MQVTGAVLRSNACNQGHTVSSRQILVDSKSTPAKSEKGR